MGTFAAAPTWPSMPLPPVYTHSVDGSVASCSLRAISGGSAMRMMRVMRVNGGAHQGSTMCGWRFSNWLRWMPYLLSRVLENRLRGARDLVVIPVELYFRLEWCCSNPHRGFECCLLKPLHCREQVCFDVHTNSGRWSKDICDDLRCPPLDSSNRVKYGTASTSASPLGCATLSTRRASTGQSSQKTSY